MGKGVYVVGFLSRSFLVGRTEVVVRGIGNFSFLCFGEGVFLREVLVIGVFIF